MVGSSLILSIALIFAHTASAEILFEGYSKVTSGGTHVGYAINRYEFDANKKQFISTSFLKTGELGGSITESLKAISTDDLKPISYQYTTLIGTQTKLIDAKFEKGKLLATIKDGAKVEKISKDLPKGTFLSTFLAYVMLKSKDGLKVDTKYDYQAIAEEDAAPYKGFALIKNQEDVIGMKALRVVNEFKNTKFISFINERGEVYSTKSPAQSIATELVAQPSQATGQFQVPTSLLKVLFGEVPTGQINEISKKSQTQKSAEMDKTQIPADIKNPPPSPIPGKQYGVPPGKGIQVKGQPDLPAGSTPQEELSHK
jgi:hypothetical protein